MSPSEYARHVAQVKKDLRADAQKTLVTASLLKLPKQEPKGKR